ncbi:MAG: hypothetical protein Fur0043_22360 [Anaerolineales bacterium]
MGGGQNARHEWVMQPRRASIEKVRFGRTSCTPFAADRHLTWRGGIVPYISDNIVMFAKHFLLKNDAVHYMVTKWFIMEHNQ